MYSTVRVSELRTTGGAADWNACWLVLHTFLQRGNFPRCRQPRLPNVDPLCAEFFGAATHAFFASVSRILERVSTARLGQVDREPSFRNCSIFCLFYAF